ncbi:MAG: T9SS type A sorting domain-containing protein [Bacteroidales bacterium]
MKAFDLSGSPKGIYFVKVQNGTKGINKKIIIH